MGDVIATRFSVPCGADGAVPTADDAGPSGTGAKAAAGESPTFTG
jgi:hypothetical protein